MKKTSKKHHPLNPVYTRETLFNYDYLNEEHKKAAKEVLSICKDLKLDTEQLESIIEEKFELEPIVEIHKNECLMVQAAEKAGIFTAVQGFTRERNGNQTYHYPVLSLICDMRKMNEIYDIIQKQALQVKELVDKENKS